MELLIATKNRGKFNEIQEMLLPLGWSFFSLEDVGIQDDFEESGSTFEANALGKARFYSGLSGLPAVADDSGIFVNALQDELGLKTRRWGAGSDASDEEWLDFFLERMRGEKDRAASFVCAAAFASPDFERVEMGETEGEIMAHLEVPVKHGIPLSSVFLPFGCDKVYADLSSSEKNEISHRGKAFVKLMTYLKQHYA